MGRRIAGLDAVRGLAIALVMLRHAFPGVFPGGGVAGVVLFFALSGFLITGLLEADVRRLGRVRFARFYLHRVWRLYPALLAFLVIFAVVEWYRGGSHGDIAKTLGFGGLYITDLGKPISPDASHLWTLSVEEQFYLVWPILFLWAARRRWVGRVVAIAVVVLLGVCALVIYYRTYPNVQDAYTLPTSWAVCLLIGAAGRIYLPQLSTLTAGRRGVVAAAAGGAAIAGFSFWTDDKTQPAMYLVAAPLLAVASVLLVLQVRLLVDPTAWLRPLAALGTISYAAYLWNYPLTVWLRESEPMHQTAMSVVAIVATLAVAALSWVTVEAAGRRARRVTDGRMQPGHWVAAPEHAREP